MGKFEVGQCWKTRCGEVVRIIAIGKFEVYPVKGDRSLTYDVDGHAVTWTTTPQDLVELLPDDNLGELGRDLLILALKKMQDEIANAQKLTTQNSGMWHRLETIDDRLFECLTALGD